MRAGQRKRIEAAIDYVAGAVLGAAVAVCTFELLAGTLARPYLWVVPACLGGLAFLLAGRFLRRLGDAAPAFQLRAFQLPELSFAEPDELLLMEQVELLLTDADRVRPRRSTEEELVLNDILAKLGPDSRVVRLFDPSAMPTPAQLNSRIEQHLRTASPPPPAPDHSEALFEALNELRRSLR